MPVHQNLVMDNQEAAIDIERGELDIAFCAECGFVFNRAFDPDKLNYNANYENIQTCSPSFSGYVDALVEHLIRDRNIQNCRIVEVGCGKGEFLRKLVTSDGARNSGYGFDPAYVGPAIDLEGRLRFGTRYYDASCATIPADVVICRHVIEHVHEPLHLLRDIHKALANSDDARVFFETPNVEWILAHQVVWDFFYEHCSYFSPDSLATALSVAGFMVDRIESVFGGQYLWLEATRVTETPTHEHKPGRVPQLALQFALNEKILVSKWKNRIQELGNSGPVVLWGAGAKGATLANLVDPGRELIAAVVDLNPTKQSRFIPGTGHRIISPEEIASLGIRTAVLMNPNYREEVVAILRDRQLQVTLIALDGAEIYEVCA